MSSPTPSLIWRSPTLSLSPNLGGWTEITMPVSGLYANALSLPKLTEQSQRVARVELLCVAPYSPRIIHGKLKERTESISETNVKKKKHICEQCHAANKVYIELQKLVGWQKIKTVIIFATLPTYPFNY